MLAAADVFIGTRLKVGDGGEGIDLRLPGQATVLVTADGLAVSGGAARLDGVPLDVAAALSERFELGLGDRVSLEGVVLGPSLTPGPFPENRVAALRLEGKGSSVRATLLLGSASLGSGENDCLRLRYPGVLPGHVRIAPWRGGCAIAPGTGLATVVGQGPLTESLLLVPGLEIELGTLVLRVA
jgi:hypothetical protein